MIRPTAAERQMIDHWRDQGYSVVSRSPDGVLCPGYLHREIIHVLDRLDHSDQTKNGLIE